MKTKKIIAGLLATAMVITGISIAPKQEAEAAMVTGIVYEFVGEDVTVGEALDFDGIKKGEGYTDPTIAYTDDVEGDCEEIADTAEYLFGGWYYIAEDQETEDISVKPISDEEYVNADDYVGYCFAKWVPASILSVKAQNTAGVTADSDSTNTRILSAVDSLDYYAVGFEILLNNKTKLDGIETTKVYDELIGSGSTYTADKIFGNGATHFVVWRLTGIEKVNFEKIIYVRPYWITADGVKVEGLAKYVHVEDEYNGYISVPVNLNVLSQDEVAAGVFEISYPDGFTLVEDKVEIGRVFGEMEFADKGSSVKFAANVADINNNEFANDIYVNLRFTVDSGSVTHASNHFEIKGTPDFCDNTEEKVTIDIWDVLY